MSTSLREQDVAVDLLALGEEDGLLLVLLRRADPVDARHRGDDQHVAPRQERARGRVPQAVDVVVHRRVLLDVEVGLRDVRLGLVVVVVGDEVLDGGGREELPELVAELRRERLVVRDHEHGPLDLLADPGHRRRLAGAGRAEERLEAVALVDRARELGDRLRLVAGRRVGGGDAERGHGAHRSPPGFRHPGARAGRRTTLDAGHMASRRLIRSLLACLAVTAAAAWAPAAPAAEPDERPSILLVLTDDQRWDTLGVMPTVQRELVGRGVTFTEAVAVNPLCCPSRATILTGQYSHTTGVYSNLPPYGGSQWFDDDSTIATWLHDAGYRTGYVGKYLNEYGGSWAPPGLDRWFTPPGWDVWLGYGGGYHAYEVMVGGLLGRAGTSISDYSTDVFTNEAVSFVRSTGDEPFFLVYAPYAPHRPATPAPRHAGTYASLDPWRPPAWNEKNVVGQAGLATRPRRARRQRGREGRRFPPPATRGAPRRRRGRRVAARRAPRAGPAREHADRVRLRQRAPLGRAPALDPQELAVRGERPHPARRPLRRPPPRPALGRLDRRERRSRADLRRCRGRGRRPRRGPQPASPPPLAGHVVAVGDPARAHARDRGRREGGADVLRPPR